MDSKWRNWNTNPCAFIQVTKAIFVQIYFLMKKPLQWCIRFTSASRYYCEYFNVLHAWIFHGILECPSMASSCMNTLLVQGNNSPNEVGILVSYSGNCIYCSMLRFHSLSHALNYLIAGGRAQEIIFHNEFSSIRKKTDGPWKISWLNETTYTKFL